MRWERFLFIEFYNVKAESKDSRNVRYTLTKTEILKTFWYTDNHQS